MTKRAVIRDVSKVMVLGLIAFAVGFTTIYIWQKQDIGVPPVVPTQASSPAEAQSFCNAMQAGDYRAPETSREYVAIHAPGGYSLACVKANRYG